MNKELIDYFNGDELAASVWMSKYQLEGEETPDDMHRRMAKEFARIEKKHQKKEKTNNKMSEYGQNRKPLTEEEIYNLFSNFGPIVPQGSIMAMLGNPQIGCLSNCFVIGQPKDSYGGILQKDEQLVQLMKRRGGVGIDISTLRPDNTPVSNSAGTSTGAVSFMERFSNSTREVAQNGRRGALMITMDVRHPDIMNFINIKKDRTKVTGANISVMLRDDFMEAVKNDEDYILRFPCDLELTNKHSAGEYNVLVEEEGIGYVKRIKAKELYDSIVENAWDNAEPGQMFVDKHWDYSPDGVYKQYKGVTTNPCGEIFMQEYDACRLMALNLFEFVKHPFTKSAKIDYKDLYEAAYEQQRLADDLVDLEIEHINRIISKIEKDPQPDNIKEAELDLWKNIKKTAAAGRRTGCGITALGDMLAALGFPYDSEKGIKVIDKVFKTKMRGELDCTIDLAIQRGSFKGWKHNKEFNVKVGTTTPFTEHSNLQAAEMIEGHKIEGTNSFYETMAKIFPEQTERMLNFGRRNVSFSTVAPTGTVSLMTQTSSGLEPLFQPYYMRRVKVNPTSDNARVDFTDQNGDSWTEHAVLHPKFKEWLNSYEKWDGFNVDDNDCLTKAFEDSPWYKSTANDINWEKRIEIQSVIQKYTSHSISSTINLPEDVSKKEVSNIYLKAYEADLKGVTIYRDNCRTGVLVSEPNTKRSEFGYVDAVKRPKSLPVDIYTTVSKGTKWNVMVGLMEDKPYELFAVPHFTNEDKLDLVRVKRGRYDLYKDGEVYSEDVTSEMNDEQEVITRLISTAMRHGANVTFLQQQMDKTHGDITSFGKAIARVLKRYIPDGELKCSNCGEKTLILEEGCNKCTSCGHSACG